MVILLLPVCPGQLSDKEKSKPDKPELKIENRSAGVDVASLRPFKIDRKP